MQKKAPDADRVVEEDNSIPMNEVTSRLDAADGNDKEAGEEENNMMEEEDESERIKREGEWLEGWKVKGITWEQNKHLLCIGEDKEVDIWSGAMSTLDMTINGS